MKIYVYNIKYSDNDISFNLYGKASQIFEYMNNESLQNSYNMLGICSNNEQLPDNFILNVEDENNIDKCIEKYVKTNYNRNIDSYRVRLIN